MGPGLGACKGAVEEEAAKTPERLGCSGVGDVEEEGFAESLVLLPEGGVKTGDRGWGRLVLVRHGVLLHAWLGSGRSVRCARGRFLIYGETCSPASRER